MSELSHLVTNVTFIVAWLMVGPLFAIILFHLAEKRWQNGPTWAGLGFLFNVFALLAFLLIAGYEASEASSIGGIEARRVREIMQASGQFRSFERRAVWNEDPREEDVAAIDNEIESLLALHKPDEALARARERYSIAFQHGDTAREELYRNYVASIEAEDNARRTKLAELHPGGQIRASA